jgi:type IV secretory pathway component VirB8
LGDVEEVDDGGGCKKKRQSKSLITREILAVVVAAALLLALVEVLVMVVPLTKSVPMVATVVHEDEDGAGCSAGVMGSPWWKVDVP